jgi:hypothetical protein
VFSEFQRRNVCGNKDKKDKEEGPDRSCFWICIVQSTEVELASLPGISWIKVPYKPVFLWNETNPEMSLRFEVMLLKYFTAEQRSEAHGPTATC